MGKNEAGGQDEPFQLPDETEVGGDMGSTTVLVNTQDQHKGSQVEQVQIPEGRSDAYEPRVDGVFKLLQATRAPAHYRKMVRV